VSSNSNPAASQAISGSQGRRPFHSGSAAKPLAFRAMRDSVAMANIAKSVPRNLP
jgi:hypothetical protein